MLQLIALIIFIISILGVIFIFYRKMPVLAKLPENGHHGLKKPKFVVSVENKIKDFHFNFFEKQVLLHKFLSKTKVWLLKIETGIDKLLYGMRKKAQELDKKNGKK